MLRPQHLYIAVLSAFSALALSGCVSKEFFDEQMTGLNGRINSLQNELKQAQSGLTKLDAGVGKMQEQVGYQSDRLNVQSERLSLVNDRSAKVEQRLGETQSELQGRINAARKDTESRLAEVNTATVQTRQAAEAAKAANESLNATLAATTQKLEQVGQTAEVAKAASEKLSATLAETGQKLEQVGQAAQAAKAGNESLNATLAATTQKLGQVGEIAQVAKTTADQVQARALKGNKVEESFVHFKLESAVLSKEAKAALLALAEQAKKMDGEYAVEIRGFTDATGTDVYNLRLGADRAKAVKLYLVREAGLPLHRVTIVSYGKLDPMATNKKREGRSQNRRVGVTLIR